MSKKSKIAVASFWIRLPKSCCDQIIKSQQEWADAYEKDGQQYYMISLQPFAYRGEMKVSIIPAKVGRKIEQHISK